MKLKFIVCLCCLLALIVSPNHANAQINDEAQIKFLQSLIKSINDDDIQALKSIIHPSSLKAVSTDTQAYYDNELFRILSYQIPKNFSYELGEIPSDAILDRPGLYQYPVRPTNSLRITYHINENEGIFLTRKIVKDNSQWYIILPTPEALALELMAQARESQKEQKDQINGIISSLKKKDKNDLRKMIDEGNYVAAYSSISKSKNISIGLAKQVVDRLQ